ncbi:hypothetical protein [Streptomyces sp. P10-4]
MDQDEVVAHETAGTPMMHGDHIDFRDSMTKAPEEAAKARRRAEA